MAIKVMLNIGSGSKVACSAGGEQAQLIKEVEGVRRRLVNACNDNELARLVNYSGVHFLYFNSH